MKNIILILIVCLFSGFTFNGSLTGSVRANDPKQKIMFLGDSITFGNTTDWGFRKTFQDDVGILTYDYVGSYSSPSSDAVYNVKHSGVNYQNLEAIESRLAAELTASKPDIVFLHAGTNPDGSIAASMQNIEDIVTLCGARDVYISTIIPHPDEDAYNTDFNAALISKVQALQVSKENLYLIRMEESVEADDFSLCSGNFGVNCLQDGIHPNAAGYNAMAHVLSSSIEDCAEYSRCDI